MIVTAFSYLRSVLSLMLIEGAMFVAPKDEKASLATAIRQHAVRVLDGQKYR